MSGSTGDFAAWVRAGTTQVELGYWGAIGHPARERLARHHVEVADVAVGHADGGFDILRRSERPGNQGLPEVGGVVAQRGDNRLGDPLTGLVPRLAHRVPRVVQRPARHDVLPRRRQGRVPQRRNLHADERMRSRPALFAGIPACLEVCDRWADAYVCRQLRVVTGAQVAGKIGQVAQRRQKFDAVGARPQVGDTPPEPVVQ